MATRFRIIDLGGIVAVAALLLAAGRYYWSSAFHWEWQIAAYLALLAVVTVGARTAPARLGRALLASTIAGWAFLALALWPATWQGLGGSPSLSAGASELVERRTLLGIGFATLAGVLAYWLEPIWAGRSGGADVDSGPTRA